MEVLGRMDDFIKPNYFPDWSAVAPEKEAQVWRPAHEWKIKT